MPFFDSPENSVVIVAAWNDILERHHIAPSAAGLPAALQRKSDRLSAGAYAVRIEGHLTGSVGYAVSDRHHADSVLRVAARGNVIEYVLDVRLFIPGTLISSQPA